MRDYELVFIIGPEVIEENIITVTDRVSGWITSGAGEVTNVNVWGRRRLAYPIRDNREGTYATLQFKMAPQATGELERSIKLAEDILRYLLVRMGE